MDVGAHPGRALLGTDAMAGVGTVRQICTGVVLAFTTCVLLVKFWQWVLP